MADVFLSYAHEDRRVAEHLAHAIAKHGLTVWSDHQIRVGTVFPRAIEHELDAALCVVVVWSQHSVNSDWVRSEAADGLSRNILVPVTIEPEIRFPLQFRQLRTADLSGWPTAHDGFNECIRAVREIVNASKASPPQQLPVARAVKVSPRKQMPVTSGSPVNPVPLRPPQSHAGWQPLPHGAYHSKHHAVTTSPLAEDQPLLWASVKGRTYFTIKHPAVVGALIAFFLLLTLLVFITVWIANERPPRNANALINSQENPAPNFTLKLVRPGFGPPAEPAASSPA